MNKLNGNYRQLERRGISEILLKLEHSISRKFHGDEVTIGGRLDYCILLKSMLFTSLPSVSIKHIWFFWLAFPKKIDILTPGRDCEVSDTDISFIIEAKSDIEFIAGEGQLVAELAVVLSYVFEESYRSDTSAFLYDHTDQFVTTTAYVTFRHLNLASTCVTLIF